MMRRQLLIIILAVSAFTTSLSADAVEGKELFTANCKACHSLEMRLVGPALLNVDQRHEEAWLLSFIKSSNSMIAAGDAAAIELFNTYNKIPMPDQSLSDDQIRSILAYIKGAGGADEANPIERPVVIKSSAKPLKFSDFRFWIIYTVTVLLTVLAVYFKAEMNVLTKKVEHQDKDE